MKYPTFLIPHKYKTLLTMLFLVSLGGGILVYFGGYTPNFLNIEVSDFIFGRLNSSKIRIGTINNLADEISGILILLSGLALMFCAEKDEDELVGILRLNAMYWSISLNIILLCICIILFYDTLFFLVMMFNMISVPILFLLKFQWSLYRFKTSVVD